MNAGEKKHLGRVSQNGDECSLMKEVEGKEQDPAISGTFSPGFCRDDLNIFYNDLRSFTINLLIILDSQLCHTCTH